MRCNVMSCHVCMNIICIRFLVDNIAWSCMCIGLYRYVGFKFEGDLSLMTWWSQHFWDASGRIQWNSTWNAGVQNPPEQHHDWCSFWAKLIKTVRCLAAVDAKRAPPEVGDQPGEVDGYSHIWTLFSKVRLEKHIKSSWRMMAQDSSIAQYTSRVLDAWTWYDVWTSGNFRGVDWSCPVPKSGVSVREAKGKHPEVAWPAFFCCGGGL